MKLSSSPALAAGLCVLLAMTGWAAETRLSAPVAADGAIVIEIATADDLDPVAAGKAAALALKARMGETELHAVLVSECFEEKELKQAALAGIASVFPKERIFGCATYGSFDRTGCHDLDSVTLLGIGGDGVGVSAALTPNLDSAALTMEDDLELLTERLQKGGRTLAQDIPKSAEDQLLIVLADAHSPKNQFLVEGLQQTLGPDFPITGGSANKNVGQTFVYYAGEMYEDAAMALMLSGAFKVAMAGRQAQSNDAVISSAGEAAAEAKKNLGGEAVAALAFNCAGRKGRLDRLEDELAAIQDVIGAELPLFGCYCAGEVGPADSAERTTDALSSGVGWHIMFTLLGR